MPQRLNKSQQQKQQDFLYIGLMSGTSIDGIDVALVKINGDSCQLLANHLHPIDEELKNQLNSICNPNLSQATTPHQDPIKNQLIIKDTIDQLGQLDHQIGLIFAEAVNQFLENINLNKKLVRAIGSHGQTIRHRPNQQHPFTLQIGDANLIAYHTGITTITDFRRMDMAAGGQGAPLVPAFHRALMQSEKENRIILNLGGIANITLLPQDLDKPVIGFDTGPANTLLDNHFKQCHQQGDYDQNGDFAKSGEMNRQLLNHLLADEYFSRAYPKSTGREYFSAQWLGDKLKDLNIELSPQSIQATLVALTVETIADAFKQLSLTNYQVYACGGGVHNDYLMTQLSQKIQQPIMTTNQLGVNGDYLEAMTFAWLAHQRLENLTGNLTSVTGARENKILGAVYHP